MDLISSALTAPVIPGRESDHPMYRPLTDTEKKITESYLLAPHLRAIGEAARIMGVKVSVRPAKAETLEKLAEGSKPKPHSIMEKTISESSLRKAYRELKEFELRLGQMKQHGLLGYAGHWDTKTGKLIGLYVMDPPHDLKVADRITVRKESTSKPSMSRAERQRSEPSASGIRRQNSGPARRDSAATGIASQDSQPAAARRDSAIKTTVNKYYPIDPDNLEESLAELKRQPNYQSFMVTGDYDTHDLLLSRGPVPQGLEGRYLDALNLAVGVVDPKRNFEDKRSHVFQHGPQHNYSAFVRNVENGLPNDDIASTSLPVAMCNKGTWSIIETTEELEQVYRSSGAVIKEQWAPISRRTSLDLPKLSRRGSAPQIFVSSRRPSTGAGASTSAAGTSGLAQSNEWVAFDPNFSFGTARAVSPIDEVDPLTREIDPPSSPSVNERPKE